MKVTDLRRKLKAALIAGGLLTPSAAHAAELNTNLLANPGFESVDDTGTLGAYSAPRITNWTASTPDKQGFAYSHDGSVSNGEFVPNYANGEPLASGGSWYFTPNAGPDNAIINGPGQFYQDIDVSTGPSGSLIASGNAAYRTGAFFNNFETQGDFGRVHLDFRNSAMSSIGMAEVAGVPPFEQWEQNFRSGTIPVGTHTVRVSIYGTAVAGGPDGYMDNVEFQVSNEVIQPTLGISVNRETGGISLLNQTGVPVTFRSYAITSAYGALEPANWLSIADNYDAGSPGPNQFDPLHNWSELTDPATNSDLIESDLQASAGAALAHTRTINLGNAGTWIQTPTEDLVFQYNTGTQDVQGIVTYTGHSGSAFANGDFNVDGAINSADWMIFRANQHGDFTGRSGAEAYRLGDISGDLRNDHTDFVIFKTVYDAANGAGAFVAMVASVPEPASVMLVIAAGLFIVSSTRQFRIRG
jgi:hypothetical protein